MAFRTPRLTKSLMLSLVVVAVAFALISWVNIGPSSVKTRTHTESTPHIKQVIQEGKQTFRYDTFESEEFWGGELRLHEAIMGDKLGGVGPGVSPKTALSSLGLKVDAKSLPPTIIEAIKTGRIDLNDPATTVELLKLNAVVGVTGFFNDHEELQSIGIQCALCHSTVDNSVSFGIGHRLDGWANRDLNIGAIIASAPNLSPFAELLQVNEDTVRRVLLAWGPGKFDAQLILDGKGFRPDGKTAATLIPPAFGLAGINLHTWTGFGSVPYWNAFVAVLEMHGKGSFFDERLNNPAQFPVAARAGLWNIKNEPDVVSPKLPALHIYQLALAAPPPPEGSFDPQAAARGQQLFNGKAYCATCHVPPTFSEPGFDMHRPEAIGIDSFQADRSPEFRYRTSPLKGLWTHQKGGFYHDGRFKSLIDVVNHYNQVFQLELTTQEKKDLVEYLRSI